MSFCIFLTPSQHTFLFIFSVCKIMILLQSVGSYRLVWLQEQGCKSVRCVIPYSVSLTPVLRFLVGALSYLCCCRVWVTTLLLPGTNSSWLVSREMKLRWWWAALGILFNISWTVLTPAPVPASHLTCAWDALGNTSHLGWAKFCPMVSSATEGNRISSWGGAVLQGRWG